MYKVLDIFSGIGGFSLGLEKSGMQTVAFCEINPFCQKVLSKHWLDVPRLKNDRLNPDWVEWLMGYPIGWTEGGSFRERIMALGNSVVPLIPEFLGMAIDAKEICTRRESMLLRKEKIQKGVK